MKPVDDLIKRINGEFDAARDRIRALQAQAVENYHRLQERHQRFLKATRRIGELLRPRIDAFSSEFQNLNQTITLIRQGPQGREVHGALAIFSFPHTEECPAAITLTFSMGHDEEIEHVILTYHLDIVPLFIKFNDRDSLAVSIDKLDENQIVAWFDDKLVEFTKIYMNIFFIPQYQGNSQVPDLVLGITFPRNFAAGSKEHEGKTYYFYTEESLREFEANPARYAGTGQPEPHPASMAAESSG
jgi:YHS domain-containing protein